MPLPDRRSQIAGAAIELIAESGVRALTHRALDRRLSLPEGSTSYYFRTRRALLEAVATELADRARQDFVASALSTPSPDTGVDEIAGAIAAYVDRLLVARKAETLARYALSIELQQDPDLRSLAVSGPFSVEASTSLMFALGAPDARAAGEGLVSLLEGVLFSRTAGSTAPPEPRPGPAGSRASLAVPVAAYLRGVAGPSAPAYRPSDTEARPGSGIE
ncbi:MAG TPA: TetR family transcriptional regulator [Nocardioidaceae bacterium]|nr:TetR family transcriptional regulator [Nocardioidaceae bacterium]